MNTIPAGMPMMTGQGSELEAGVKMGVMGGFVSANEDGAKKEKAQNKFPTLKCYHVLFYCKG